MYLLSFNSLFFAKKEKLIQKNILERIQDRKIEKTETKSATGNACRVLVILAVEKYTQITYITVSVEAIKIEAQREGKESGP